MWRRWLQQGFPIGCDFSAGQVRLAQIQKRGGTEFCVTASGSMPSELAEDDAAYRERLSGLIHDLLRGSRFQGRNVVSALPYHHLIYRMMRVAPMSEPQLSQAIHWKAASELGLKGDGFKSAVLSFGTVNDGSKTKLEILLVAAELARLDQHAAILTAAGLRPVAIDTSICAVLRCLVHHLPAPTDSAQIILELGPASAMLAILKDKEIAFVRPLGEGLARVDQLAAEMLQAPVAEVRQSRRQMEQEGADVTSSARMRDVLRSAACMYARDLGREVALSLNYYADAFRRPVPAAGIVLGLTAVTHDALEPLNQQSGIVLQGAQQLLEPVWRDQTRTNADAWATAIGLSLYYQPESAMKAVA